MINKSTNTPFYYSRQNMGEGADDLLLLMVLVGIFTECIFKIGVFVEVDAVTLNPQNITSSDIIYQLKFQTNRLYYHYLYNKDPHKTTPKEVPLRNDDNYSIEV